MYLFFIFFIGIAQKLKNHYQHALKCLCKILFPSELIFFRVLVISQNLPTQAKHAVGKRKASHNLLNSIALTISSKTFTFSPKLYAIVLYRWNTFNKEPQKSTMTVSLISNVIKKFWRFIFSPPLLALEFFSKNRLRTAHYLHRYN